MMQSTSCRCAVVPACTHQVPGSYAYVVSSEASMSQHHAGSAHVSCTYGDCEAVDVSM